MREWLKSRLSGEVPLPRAFFHDMLALGTLINVVTGLVALGLFSFDHLAWLALLIFVSPLPYNIVVGVAVWRSAARERSPLSGVARMVTLIWFPCMLMI